MPRSRLEVLPIQAPVQSAPFDLQATLAQALKSQVVRLQQGDVLAISSKYVAISENRVVTLDEVVVSDLARDLAARFNMDARLAELVIQEADHIFGGIPLGYLLTYHHGIIAANAGIDRSNIPDGQVVLLPHEPYESAYQLRQWVLAQYAVHIGILITDSWLVPGRYGTTGVAVAAAGFQAIEDERGKDDLFGNPMAVTQRGVADNLSVAAQMVMGERDEATPFALIRGADVQLTDAHLSQATISIPWEMDLYVEALTVGILPDGAPKESYTAKLDKRCI